MRRGLLRIAVALGDGQGDDLGAVSFATHQIMAVDDDVFRAAAAGGVGVFLGVGVDVAAAAAGDRVGPSVDGVGVQLASAPLADDQTVQSAHRSWPISPFLFFFNLTILIFS